MSNVFKNFKTSNQESGFTLVESLVAISILLIGVLGPLVLATRGISDGISTKNKITASYLAQEGQELAIAKREINLKDKLWSDGLIGVGCDTAGTGCAVTEDLNSGEITFTPCGATNNNCQLQYDTNSSVLRYVSNPTSPRGPIFTRKIFIEDTGYQADQQLTILSEVTWSEKGVAKDPYSLKTFLYKK